jgi:hypothetical protein
MIGKALMSEGISDMIIAVKDCLINRDFSWKSYGIQKAISIIATIICCGKLSVLIFLKECVYSN